MRLYFDRATQKLVNRPGFAAQLTVASLKRGDLSKLELRIYDDAANGEAVVELPADPEIKFGLKAGYDGGLLALADTWALDGGVYRATLNTNTVEMIAAVGSKSSIVCLGELSITTSDGGPTSSQTVSITVENDVIREGEGTPINMPEPDEYVALRALLYDRVQGLTEPQLAQVLANLGILGYSSGGNAADDFGKLAKFGETGWLKVSTQLQVPDAAAPGEGMFLTASRILANIKGGFTSAIKWLTFTANREIWVPDRSGWMVLQTEDGADDKGGLMRDSGGKQHVVGWNPDQNKFQGIAIRGAAGAETTFVYDLP